MYKTIAMNRLAHTKLHIEFSKYVPLVNHYISMIYYSLIQVRFGKSHKVAKRFYTLMTSSRYFNHISMLLEENLCYGKGWSWNPPKPYPSLTNVYYGNKNKKECKKFFEEYESNIERQTAIYHNHCFDKIHIRLKKITIYEYSLIQNLYKQLLKFDDKFKLISTKSIQMGYDYKLKDIQKNINRTLQSMNAILTTLKPFIDNDILREFDKHIDRDSMSIIKRYLYQ